MSKIAELLKLAEQKKEEKPKLEAVPQQSASTSLPDNKKVSNKEVVKPTKGESQVSTPSTVSQVSTPSQPSTVSTGNDNSKSVRTQSIAPERDFQKVANSVVRHVAEGVFTGKSKQMYDYLYSLTRGAIQPRRSVRISKPKLMKGTGIGSPQTFYRNINHLESLGLIKRNEIIGEWSGNEYEVFLPEEINLKIVESVQSVQSVQSAQKQVVLVLPETELTVPTSKPINTGTSEVPKTSLKTLSYIDDDAPVINLLEMYNGMARKLTGKDLTKKDLEKLTDIAEMLVTETVIAAARTGTVSSPISFMAENLRRRLYSKPKPGAKKEARPKHLNVGKGSEQSESTLPSQETQSLTDEQRQNTLEGLKEAKAANTIFYREFKTYGEVEYTPEDFKWLIKNLEEK